MRKSLKKNPVVGNLFCNWYCCNKFILTGEWLKFDMCTVNTRDIIEHLLDWAIKIQYTFDGNLFDMDVKLPFSLLFIVQCQKSNG